MIFSLLIIFLVLLIFGVPIAIALGLSSVFSLIIFPSFSLIIVIQRMFVSVNSFPLLALPLFMLAGLLMASGGISKRIIDFSYSFVGGITGGLAHVTILASMIFAGISGAAVADTVAIGNLLIPSMISKKYSASLSASVTSIASTIGIIIPPSIPMVILGSMLGISVGRLFIGGIIPGIVIGLSLMITSYFIAKKRNLPTEKMIFSTRKLLKNFWQSIWSLLMPIIIIGGIVLGIFTPTEAGAMAVVYALIIGFFVYKELTIKYVIECIWEAALTSAKILMIIATAGLFSWLLVVNGLPEIVKKFLFSITESPTLMMFIIMFILITITTFMESLASLVIFVPIFYPVTQQIGIDPIYFGVMMTIGIAVGLITPPVGLCLYAAVDIAGINMFEVLKDLKFYLLVELAIVIILIFLPQLVTYLPNLIMG